MGFFSFNCMECKHPMLSRHATDKGINEWMSQGVALVHNDSRIVGEYDGYGRLGDTEIEYGSDVAWLHRACWEVAGKPEYSHYGKPSPEARDQGYFFEDGAHDLIDPRIKEGREELLRLGVAARTKARYDAKARQIADWAECGYRPDGKRFGFMEAYKDGQALPDQWFVYDNLGEFFKDSDANFLGTRDEVMAHCEKLWGEFLKSPEGVALLAHAAEIEAEAC